MIKYGLFLKDVEFFKLKKRILRKLGHINQKGEELSPDDIQLLNSDESDEIVQEALRLGVPIEQTWSCYSGGEHPCGVCDSCRIRDAALIEAGRPDLTSP